MKKVVVLNGSPHENGCTSALIEEVRRSAEKQGAAVKAYYLNGMNIRGCQGCCKCKERALRPADDMEPVYDDIIDADGIVLAPRLHVVNERPVETAVDRLFAFLRPGRTSALKPGKKVLLLFTQGQRDTEMFRHYFEHVGRNMQFMGFGDYKILVAGGTHRLEDVLCQKDVLEQAEEMGKWLSK